MHKLLVTPIVFLAVFLAGFSPSEAQGAPDQSETLLRVEPADYPRIVKSEGGTVTIHHPQIERQQRGSFQGGAKSVPRSIPRRSGGRRR